MDSSHEEIHDTLLKRGLDIDEAIHKIGDFGPYQKKIFVLVSAAWIFCAFQSFLMIFTDRPIDRVCKEGFEDVCAEDVTQCAYPEAWRFDVDPDALPTSTRIEWNLVCEEEWKGDAVGSIFFLGFLLGAGHFGTLADQNGRKSTFFRSMLVSSLCGTVGAFSPNYWFYALCRLGVGYGIAGFGLTCFVLPNEFVGTSWRGFTCSVSNVFYALGLTILGPLAYLVQPWRSLLLLVSLVPLVYLPVYHMIPESPRWLLVVQRSREAEEALLLAAAENDVKISDITLKPPEVLGNSNAVELFRRTKWCNRTLTMMYAWFSISFVYYGVSLNVGRLSGSVYMNGFLTGLAELPAYVFVVLVLDAWGRRATLSIVNLLTSMMCLLCGALPQEHVLIAALVGKFAITAAFCIAFTYAQEMFPTIARSTGMGLCSQAARVGGILSPIVVSFVSTHPTVPMTIFGATMLLAGSLTTTLPETAHRKLPQTLEDDFVMAYPDGTGHIYGSTSSDASSSAASAAGPGAALKSTKSSEDHEL